MKILFILAAVSVICANGKNSCVHCPHPMDLAIADNILKQALLGLVPDNGPNYLLVRTKSGKSIGSHIYGPIYVINGDFKEANAAIEKNCDVEIIENKGFRDLKAGSGPEASYGQVKFRCGNEAEVVKKLKLGSIQHPYIKPKQV